MRLEKAASASSHFTVRQYFLFLENWHNSSFCLCKLFTRNFQDCFQNQLLSEVLRNSIPAHDGIFKLCYSLLIRGTYATATGQLTWTRNMLSKWNTKELKISLVRLDKESHPFSDGIRCKSGKYVIFKRCCLAKRWCRQPFSRIKAA